MKIDVWTDIVCPFCYIGARNLELALAQRAGDADASDVEITWHSYQLDPNSPAVGTEPVIEALATKFGMSPEEAERNQQNIAATAKAAGLDYDYESVRFANTFDAHRLVHLAASHGLADAMQSRLMRANFAEGATTSVGDRDDLTRLAVEVGLPEAEVREMLAGDRFADEVRADQQAARHIGVRGVPFFVLDEKLAVSGAQPVEVFLQAFDQVAQEAAAR